MWSAEHRIIFNKLIKYLEMENIKYFILRNYELLPEDNISKDVDIIIEPGSYNKASKILLDIFREEKLTHYYVVRYEKVRCWLGMNTTTNFSIHIDLIEGYFNKGFEIFSFEELYKNTIKYKNFMVLNEKYDGIMLLIYKLVACKYLKDEYKVKILDSYKNNKNDFINILTKVIGAELTKKIINCIEKENFNELISYSNQISIKSKQISFKKYPIRTIRNIAQFIWEKISRIIFNYKKYTKTIAVQAPDGAGKTTFLEEISKRILHMFGDEERRIHYYHFRPTILPNLGEVGENIGVMKQDKDFTNPHRGKLASPLSSFVRMFYYWLDYIIGNSIYLRKDVQFDKFSVFDRYIYDFIIDPQRSKINLPKIIRKIFVFFTPKPKIVFYLYTKPEIIYQRKQELTLNEIERQLYELKKLANHDNNFIELDAAKTPDRIAQEALIIILNKFAKRI